MISTNIIRFPAQTSQISMSYEVVVFNGHIVSGSEILPPSTYIGINNGVICTISSTSLQGELMIDAKGAFVTPGGIDAHVHVEEPKMPYCDTFLNCTKGALAGGTTSIIAFAIQNEKDTEESSSVLEDIASYKEVAQGNCYCDYGFHLIVRKPSKALLAKLPQVKDMGVSSIKVYTTYESLRLDDSQLLAILLENKKLGITQMIHAENHDIIKFFNEKLQEKSLLSPYYHEVSRPVEAEDEASYRVISLSKIIDIPILIVHMSAKKALDHVRAAQDRLIPIMAETCPQYLFLKAALMKGNCHHDEFEGAKYVCSPPLRETEEELNGVWESIQNGTVTILSSDHAPSSYDDIDGKKKGLVEGKPDYKKIPNGLPGVETRVPLMFCYGVEQGKISPQRFAEITASNPAKLYGLEGKKGTIQVGHDADLVVWHPKGEINFKLKNEMLLHQYDYTPFEGMEFSNWPKYTLLRGKVVYTYEKNDVLNLPQYGKFLFRKENSLKKAFSPVNALFT